MMMMSQLLPLLLLYALLVVHKSKWCRFLVPNFAHYYNLLLSHSLSLVMLNKPRIFALSNDDGDFKVHVPYEYYIILLLYIFNSLHTFHPFPAPKSVPFIDDKII